MYGEVADEALGIGVDIVAIAELPVEEQTVVEEPAAEQSFIFCIVEALIAWCDIGSEGEGVACSEEIAHDATHSVVELLGEGAAEKTLHCEGALTDFVPVPVIVPVPVSIGSDTAWGIEATDSKEIEYLLVHLLGRIDDGADHLACVGGEAWQVEVEGYGGFAWCAGDIHEAVDGHVIGGEGAADIEVGEGHAVEGV